MMIQIDIDNPRSWANRASGVWQIETSTDRSLFEAKEKPHGKVSHWLD